MSPINSNERQLFAQFVYDRLNYAFGDVDVSREVAAKRLSEVSWRAGLSDEVRDMVLDMFEPERIPVPGLDFLPEHGEAVAP